MKKLIILISVFAASFLCIQSLFSKDVIHLKKGLEVRGYITDLTENKVTIVLSKNETEKKFVFTPDQVDFIEFDLKNVNIARILALNADYTVLDGRADAEIYHKRFGGNFALGFFFGVFGFIGVAVGNVKDPPTYIDDWEGKMKDGDYVIGYEKKGKGKNMGAAGLGWGISFVIMLIILL